MWRDILVIVMAIIGVLAWLGVRPSRIAQLTSRYITPNRLFVPVTVTLTIGAICIPIVSALYRGETIKWGFMAALLYLCLIPWQTIIDYHFSPQGRLRKVILLLRRFGFFPVLALLWIELDATVWYKVTVTAGGFLGGIGIGLAEGYIHKWRSSKKQRSNKTEV